MHLTGLILMGIDIIRRIILLIMNYILFLIEDIFVINLNECTIYYLTKKWYCAKDDIITDKKEKLFQEK